MGLEGLAAVLQLYDTPDTWRQVVLRDSRGVPVGVLFPYGTGYRYLALREYDALMGLTPLWVQASQLRALVRVLPLYDTPDTLRQPVPRDLRGVRVGVLFPYGTGYRYPDLRGYDVQTALAPQWV